MESAPFMGIWREKSKRPVARICWPVAFQMWRDAEASRARSGRPKSQRQRISVARSPGRRQQAARMWTKLCVPRFDSATDVDGWGREADLGG
jgi:hypothetical protein